MVVMHDLATLAALVVYTAKNDMTSPDQRNPRTGWQTDVLLCAIEAWVARGEKDPGAYAKLCRMILAGVSALPEVAAFVMLGVLNGERRLPADLDRDAAIARMIEQLGQMISELPEGTRKQRCRTLLDYQIGVWCNERGRFDVAADAQHRSATTAARMGDRAGEAISRFLEVYYLLKADLVRGASGQSMDGIVSSMGSLFLALKETLRGHTLEVLWAQGNGPAHIIEILTWLNRTDAAWDTWVTSCLQAALKIGDAWAPIAELVRALQANAVNTPQAEAMLRNVVEADTDSGRKATALLVLMRRAIRAGQLDEAKVYVLAMPEIGTQHIRAVALRELAAATEEK